MTNAEKILNKCEHILDDYDADYRGGYVTNINGTDYIVFKYYGGINDTIDRNDDSWDEIYDLEGVADVGYGNGYGERMKGTNYYGNSDCLVIELEDGLNESIKSARKSIKESRIDEDAVVYEFTCLLNRLGFKGVDYSNEENNEKRDDIIYMIMDLLKTMPQL